MSASPAVLVDKPFLDLTDLTSRRERTERMMNR